VCDNRARAARAPTDSACPCCGGALRKLGEDVTEMLELVPRQWKVIEHVREKFSCRSCEAITQPPAPSHPIARGRAGPHLLAHVLFSKYGLHLPLHRQSAAYAARGHRARGLDAGRLGRRFLGSPDAVGRSDPRAHVFAAELAKGKTRTGAIMGLCAR
jgi:transposase